MPPKNLRTAISEPFAKPIVKGRLRLKEHGESGETSVGIEIIVWPDWMRYLPFARTDAAFLRNELDWHIPIDQVLCYGLDDEWRWQLETTWDKGVDSNTLIRASAYLCIRNIDSLITRHLHGHRYGIKNWPKQWGQWGHGNVGVREFYSMVGA